MIEYFFQLAESIGAPAALFVAAIAVAIWINFNERNARVDSIKTVNDLSKENAKQLAELQREHRILLRKYADTATALVKTQAKLQLLMQKYFTDKKDWTEERRDLLAKVTDFQNKLKELTIQIESRDSELTLLRKRS